MSASQKILESIQVDEFSATPKYLQLSNSIVKGIQAGLIVKGDMMPSINEVSFEFDISRVTAEKGYNHLKSIGVLGSVPGKGYFIKSTEYTQTLKVFLLFNKLSPHKKIIYDSFVETLGAQAAIDFYIYNNDFGLFKRLIEQRKEEYTHYVIIPHFIEGEEKAYEVINTLPKDHLIILDKIIPRISGDFGAVYQNFERDIYTSLEKAGEELARYETLNLIFPENSYAPREIIDGFIKFCQNYAFNYRIISSIQHELISENQAYINIMEDDLVLLIEKIMAQSLVLGQQVGIISYNETPLKRLILNGLTTISTDFKAMGKKAAELILTNSKEHIENPFYLTLRCSL
ncbi:GntR family transcriptional regulator [Arundinibacter roseus]|uniref:GntR family transcriptional regulator n=1 Tax=Arundinibacter roseus TaxID=2070510 RepID=A0A4R4K2C1_9BACT|nr:GntR family transcriptional regulator [Arundinibacter roseus]TDB61428.1 GntR family transcriptional regulator [Arundinibacter roseus]